MRFGVMGLSVPNMIMLDINDAESTARQPITRERIERNISQGFMKKLGKTGKISSHILTPTTPLLCVKGGMSPNLTRNIKYKNKDLGLPWTWKVQLVHFPLIAA